MASIINSGPREVGRGDPAYPARLAAPELSGHAPDPLWIAGAWSPAERAVAVVGARAATGRAIELARAIGAVLTGAGVDVISGGALGVDAAAHRGALENFSRGATVAVLGTGIDVAYPSRHVPLYQEIVASGGALVTQFPPGQQPRPGSFPTRNQVIAALADLVIVVEASAESGSLYTARAAQKFGRVLAAVPGSPGTDALIVAGAHAIGVADDALAVLDGRAPAPPPLPDEPGAAALYAALDHTPRDVSDLAFRAGLAIGTCTAIVIDLELGGLAARAAGGRYVRLR